MYRVLSCQYRGFVSAFCTVVGEPTTVHPEKVCMIHLRYPLNQQFRPPLATSGSTVVTLLDTYLPIIPPVDYLSKTVVAVMPQDLSRIRQDFEFINSQAPSFNRYFELMRAGQKIIFLSIWRQQAMAYGATHRTSPLARIAAMLNCFTDKNVAAI
jgi:hypothetical protein